MAFNTTILAHCDAVWGGRQPSHLGDLAWPATGEIGRHELTFSDMWCRKIKRVTLRARVTCAEKLGDDFAFHDCPLKLIDGGGNELDELTVEAADLVKRPEGGCGINWRVKLKSDCIQPGRICWVTLEQEIEWKDGGVSRIQIIVQAKEF